MKPIITHVAAGETPAVAFNPDGSTRKRFFFEVEHDHPYLVIARLSNSGRVVSEATIEIDTDRQHALEAWLDGVPEIQNFMHEQVEAVVRWTTTQH